MPDGACTLGRWTADRARTAPEAVAIDDRGVALTYRELDERAERLAAAFRTAGYAIGDRVATITGNSADHVVLFFACAKAGLVLVPLSWRLSPRELSEQLEIADPVLISVQPAAPAHWPSSVPTASAKWNGMSGRSRARKSLRRSPKSWAAC
jgi:fatty-acyl-CoA synthase